MAGESPSPGQVSSRLPTMVNPQRRGDCRPSDPPVLFARCRLERADDHEVGFATEPRL